MIIIESKRKKPATILKKYRGATIIDVPILPSWRYPRSIQRRI